MNNDYLTQQNLIYNRLLKAAQIALAIGALCGALALFMVALPLGKFSWPIELTATIFAIVSMFLAVIFLLITPSVPAKIHEKTIEN